MTQLHDNGISVCPEGEERYNRFTPPHLKRKQYYQYDYRHTNGVLFTTVAPTLEQCRQKRDKWLKTQPGLFVIDLNGHPITVADLDKAIEQAGQMKGYWHEDTNFAQMDNRLSAYWTDIHDKLKTLKTKLNQH